MDPKIEYALTWLLHQLDLEEARLGPLRTRGHAPQWDSPTDGYVQAGNYVIHARNRPVSDHIVAWDPYRAETVLLAGRLLVGAAWMAFLPEPETSGGENASLAQRYQLERQARRRVWLHAVRFFALQFSDRDGFPGALRIDEQETASLPN